MDTFINRFTPFFRMFLGLLAEVFNWFTNSVYGMVFISLVVIGFFMFLFFEGVDKK
jgi:hypothetical protein